MSDFDDRDLRDSLQRLAGHPHDEPAAFASVQRRVQAAKRRRATVAAGGIVALCIAGLTVARLDNRSRESLTPATDGITNPTSVVTSPDPTGTTVEPTTTTVTATTSATSAPTVTGPVATDASPTSVPDTGVAPPPPNGGRAGQPATNPTGHTPGPSATGPPATGPSATGPSATAPGSSATEQAAPSATPTSAPSSTDSETFSSAHGTVTVTLRDGRLSIVGHQPESGYSYTVERSDATRIRVRFRNGDSRSQIDVTIVNGRMAGVPSEDGSGTPSTSPSSDAVPSGTSPDTAPDTTDDHR